MNGSSEGNNAKKRKVEESDADENELQIPGRGWSNGDMRPEMFPVTRQGKLQLYSSQRRWLHLSHGWSRIGADSNQFSHRVSFSQKGQKIVEDMDSEARAVRSLIAQLCEQFYRFGWATGTGGGISIRVGGPDENRPWRVFVAPSGIQKEGMFFILCCAIFLRLSGLVSLSCFPLCLRRYDW